MKFLTDKRKDYIRSAVTTFISTFLGTFILQIVFLGSVDYSASTIFGIVDMVWRTFARSAVISSIPAIIATLNKIKGFFG